MDQISSKFNIYLCLQFVIVRMKWIKHLTVWSPEILWLCLKSSSGLCWTEQCQRSLYCWSSRFLAVQVEIVKSIYKMGNSIFPQWRGSYYLTIAIPNWVYKKKTWTEEVIVSTFLQGLWLWLVFISGRVEDCFSLQLWEFDSHLY